MTIHEALFHQLRLWEQARGYALEIARKYQDIDPKSAAYWDGKAVTLRNVIGDLLVALELRGAYYDWLSQQGKAEPDVTIIGGSDEAQEFHRL